MMRNSQTHSLDVLKLHRLSQVKALYPVLYQPSCRKPDPELPILCQAIIPISHNKLGIEEGSAMELPPELIGMPASTFLRVIISPHAPSLPNQPGF